MPFFRNADRDPQDFIRKDHQAASLAEVRQHILCPGRKRIKILKQAGFHRALVHQEGISDNGKDLLRVPGIQKLPYLLSRHPQTCFPFPETSCHVLDCSDSSRSFKQCPDLIQHDMVRCRLILSGIFRALQTRSDRGSARDTRAADWMKNGC